MLIDADIIIWNWRGKTEAAEILNTANPFCLSAVTYIGTGARHA
jgi:hypothetical protein